MRCRKSHPGLWMMTRKENQTRAAAVISTRDSGRNRKGKDQDYIILWFLVENLDDFLTESKKGLEWKTKDYKTSLLCTPLACRSHSPLLEENKKGLKLELKSEHQSQCFQLKYLVFYLELHTCHFWLLWGMLRKDAWKGIKSEMWGWTIRRFLEILNPKAKEGRNLWMLTGYAGHERMNTTRFSTRNDIK